MRRRPVRAALLLLLWPVAVPLCALLAWLRAALDPDHPRDERRNVVVTTVIVWRCDAAGRLRTEERHGVAEEVTR